MGLGVQSRCAVAATRSNDCGVVLPQNDRSGTAADQRQLKAVEFRDRVFRLRRGQGLPLGGFAFGDGDDCAELVHCVLRPVELSGLLALAASWMHAGAIGLNIQFLIPVSRHPVQRLDYH